MIRYNWSALRTLPTFKHVLVALKLLTNQKADKIMTKKVLPVLRAEVLDCFMLDAKSFLLNKVGATEMEMVVYMTLISRRDYLQYKLYKTTTLPTYFAYDFDLDKLKRNKLINITNGNIHFKYEA